MICKNNKTGKYLNYNFTGKDSNLIELWDPTAPGYSEIIPYEKWLEDYTIIDKWKTIKIY